MANKRSPMQEGTLRIGLLGLGTVGCGVAEILHRHKDLIAQRCGVKLVIKRALVRTRRGRTGAAGRVPVTRDAAQIVDAADIDIVVELMGGEQPALKLMLSALHNAKSVVTANKAVVARHQKELFAAARKTGTDVYFEAAVAGGVPIIRTLREGLAADRITCVRGILNGTTNYILSRMASGNSYDSALKEAQALGFAEADPTLDVNGGDAADKLAIMIHLAFGTQVTPMQLTKEGIEHLTPDVLADARAMGYAVKLIARAERIESDDGELLDARVHPALVHHSDELSHVPANQNAVAIQSDALGGTLYQGAGAGSLPTGSAVVADLIEAARNLKVGVSGRLSTSLRGAAPKLLRPDAARSAYYMRLMVDDRPGVLAQVAQTLAAHDVSMASVLQSPPGVGPVPLVITTHVCQHGCIRRALRAITRMRTLHGAPRLVRLEPKAG